MCQEEQTGYTHGLYCESLSEFGKPRYLPQSGGWLLERLIPDTEYRDAMGCYPLFACRNWSRLNVDLEDIGDKLICVSLVTDPFGEYPKSTLKKCFPDLAVPFKEHFLVDLSRSPNTIVNSHHRRNARKALREIHVEECKTPLHFLHDWASLYGTLIERHNITGIPTFSLQSFATQFRVPGIVVFRAIHQDVTVGMLLWYCQSDRAYYHLGAYNSLGYKLGASFALFDYSIRYFAEHGFAWLNLGSGSGINARANRGLSRFKRGWSTAVRTVYFCGRILNRQRYQEILKRRRQLTTSYFPAYREGEFANEPITSFRRLNASGHKGGGSNLGSSAVAGVGRHK